MYLLNTNKGVKMADISKIDMERINGLLDKLEEVSNKINSMKHIIEEYHSGTQWYKIWSDGWIEQGGYVSNPSSNKTVTLLKSYNNINYSIQCQYAHDSNSTGRFLSVGNKTNSTFMVRTGATNLDNWSDSYPVPFYWEVKGY